MLPRLVCPCFCESVARCAATQKRRLRFCLLSASGGIRENAFAAVCASAETVHVVWVESCCCCCCLVLLLCGETIVAHEWTGIAAAVVLLLYVARGMWEQVCSRNRSSGSNSTIVLMCLVSELLPLLPLSTLYTSQYSGWRAGQAGASSRKKQSISPKHPV